MCIITFYDVKREKLIYSEKIKYCHLWWGRVGLNVERYEETLQDDGDNISQ